jgi:deazaflavin-dependent oxidoreductase (nitroreductase family)
MNARNAKQLRVRRWLRLLLRPIWLYRLWLGWFKGNGSLVLTHMERRGHSPRQTLLDVVAYDPAADTYIIASGLDKRLDWFRNVQEQPHVLVDVGDRCFEAIAARLSEAEAKHALQRYACRYPFVLRNLANASIGRHRIGMCDDYSALAHALRMIALRPVHGAPSLAMRDRDYRMLGRATTHASIAVRMSASFREPS